MNIANPPSRHTVEAAGIHTPLVPKLRLGTPLGAKLHFARRGCLWAARTDSPPGDPPPTAKCNFAPQAHSQAELGNEGNSLCARLPVLQSHIAVFQSREDRESGVTHKTGGDEVNAAG